MDRNAKALGEDASLLLKLLAELPPVVHQEPCESGIDHTCIGGIRGQVCHDPATPRAGSPRVEPPMPARVATPPRRRKATTIV
jgi:hypothetical protein